MIVTCPQCATRYHLDPASLGAKGRTVRCASCGSRWRATPPADAPRPLDLAPEVHGAPTVPRRPGMASAPARGRLPGVVVWLGGLLVVLILASTVIGRNEIVAGFPASEGIYRTLGLPLAVQPGLQFADVVSKIETDGTVRILVIEGAIVNLSERDRPVPPIRLILKDASGRQLHEELLRAQAELLGAGARTAFSGRVVNPADQAHNFDLSFAVGS